MVGENITYGLDFFSIIIFFRKCETDILVFFYDIRSHEYRYFYNDTFRHEIEIQMMES
jgi:hypothetical protein